MIQDLDDHKVLDIGCGAGPWSIYAAQNGGIVSAIDIQPAMIEVAKKATRAAGLLDKIEYVVGDATELSYEDNFFDRTISICVGCNLPKLIFKKHIQEIQRTLNTNGIAAIGAPTSLHVVFTDGTKNEAEVHDHIQKVLTSLHDNPKREEITDKLSELPEVLSATFYIKDNRLTLLTQENELQEGDKIWRKLPKPIVPNYYYRNDSYTKIFNELGLKYKTHMPHFDSETERLAYNSTALSSEQLGPAYAAHAPFAIYLISR